MRPFLAVLAVVVIALLVTVGSLYYRGRLFPSKYRPIVYTEAHRQHLDPLFVAAVIYYESRFRPQSVSSKGAIGMMQLRPATIDELIRTRVIQKWDYTRELLFNPTINIRMGTAYLRYLISRIESTAERREKVAHWFEGNPLMLACHCYHAGPTLTLQETLDLAVSRDAYDEAMAAKRPGTVYYGKEVLRTYRLLQKMHRVVGYD